MPGRAELLPAPVPTEIHALVLGSVDIARPEQADIAVLEDGSGTRRRWVGPAAEREIDEMRGHQPEPGPALELEGRCGRLVELGLTLRQPLKDHRGVARLEEEPARFAHVPQLLIAVED